MSLGLWEFFWGWTDARNLTTETPVIDWQVPPSMVGPSIDLRTWTQNLLNSTLTPTTPVGAVSTTLAPQPSASPYRHWSQNLLQTTLFTSIEVPAIDWQLPPSMVGDGTERRTWVQNLLQTTLTATVAPFAQFDWPLPRAPQWPISDRRWEWWYNQNLIGQDKLPTGEVVTDLTPRPYPPQSNQRRWEWWYNLNLVGKDQLPTGVIVSDLTPRPYPVQFNQRRWEWWYNQNLIGQDQFPPGEIRYDRQQPPPWYRSWELNLQQTTLPVPFAQYDWPNPRPYPPQFNQRRWEWSYNLNLISQDKFPPGVDFTDRPPLGPTQPDRFWGWWYNQNLTGQDQLPTGSIRYDRQQPPPWYRSWELSLQTSTLFVRTTPFAQYDWPLPGQPPVQFNQRRWEWSYNQNLIGQDQLPTGKIFTDRQQPPPWYRSWELNLQQSPISPAFQPPVIDWQIIQPLPQYRSWELNLVNSTLTATAAPFAQYDWPNPRGPQFQIANRKWEWSYNLNLVGKDQLPTGGIVTDRQQPPPWYRTWEVNLQQSTLFVSTTPFAQYDWPLPGRSPAQLNQRRWEWWYNQNLTGQDKLPTGGVIYDRQQPPPWYRSWELNLQLTTLFAITTPFAQYDWPLPGRHPVQLNQRRWEWWYNQNLIGKDQLPVLQFDWPLPRSPIGSIDLRTWALGLQTTTLPAIPFNQFDWPLPTPYPLQLNQRRWEWWYNQNLTGQDKLPTGEIVYERPPRGPLQPDRFWGWWYNQNLTGQDKLPTGQVIYDLTQRPYPPNADRRTWAWWYNLNLIGQDQLPVLQFDWPLPGRFLPPLQSFYLPPGLNQTTAVAALPFNQYIWPLPGRYPMLVQTYPASNTLLPIAPTPSPESLRNLPFFSTPGRLMTTFPLADF